VTILALGGHDFSRKRGNEAIRDYMLALAEGPEPRVCLLPTASGDPAEQIAAFRASLADVACDVSHVSLFRLEHDVVDLAEHLLAQDLIYVGGGSLVNLLAIWRAHGLEDVLRECLARGTVIAGQSAGAMCWFEWGVTRSAGPARLAPGLGLVPGILSVHYRRDPDRRRVLLDQVAEKGVPGLGIDDGAGVLIGDGRVRVAISGRERAGVWSVVPDGPGRSCELRMPAVPLPAPRPAIDEVPDAVIELRELRRGPARRGAWSRR
jgi:dipeptidase E